LEWNARPTAGDRVLTFTHLPRGEEVLPTCPQHSRNNTTNPSIKIRQNHPHDNAR
jgi:hypothetical protein